jgi:hypothetical protein
MIMAMHDATQDWIAKYVEDPRLQDSTHPLLSQQSEVDVTLPKPETEQIKPDHPFDGQGRVQ